MFYYILLKTKKFTVFLDTNVGDIDSFVCMKARMISLVCDYDFEEIVSRFNHAERFVVAFILDLRFSSGAAGGFYGLVCTSTIIIAMF